MPFDAFGHFFEQFGAFWVQFAAFFVHEKRHRRAPNSAIWLTTQSGWPSIMASSRCAPRREKFGVVHRFHGFVAQGLAVMPGLVHADKPLPVAR